ncbi:hypothetical protein [Paractinoplanes hotanensis]|uniref:Class I SAM-dependent methyltransferase n=1 Tax=Paractinoplanes hotanensis TaxID=2906497 RepID=A0ABT0Y9K9_9ACTN|nr:hypothetical protein [Actinoplanes hotanensis]MCM4082515.1 hypothetical protein [Actinoplanes hotanensis]
MSASGRAHCTHALDFAAAYDELNPADNDHRFYAALAARLGATSVLDLGRGTGTLHDLRRALSFSYGDGDGKPEAAITPEIILVAQTPVCTNDRLY